MSGYVWARTAAGELLIVLLVDGMGYVPAREDAIDLFQIEFLGPVQWPTAITQPSRSSVDISGANPVPFTNGTAKTLHNRAAKTA